MPNWKKLLVSGSDAAVNSILFNTDPSPVPTSQGSLFYDVEEQTLSAILNGTTQKIGEDLFFQVKNQTGTTIPKGTSVRFDGVVGGSGRIKITPFLADGTFPSSYFVGVTVEDLLDGEDGKVISHGKVRGIDTDAFEIGDILYASTTVAGGFQTTVPLAPNNIITVAAVLNQGTSNGEILIRPQLGSNINLDEGIKITSGLTGDLLQLQANGLWENKTLSQAGVQPTLTNPITGSGTVDFLSKFTGTTTLGNSLLFDDGTNVGIGTTTPSEKLEVTGNIKITNSLLSNQENLDVDSGALRVIVQIPSATYTAAFFDFVIKKDTNLRAGTVYACHDGTNVEFTETSTADLGTTEEVILSVDLSAGNLRLLALTTTNDWTIKTLVRGL